MERRLDAIWLLLLGASTLAWWVDRLAMRGPGVVLLLLLLVWFKGWLIVDEFMGLRQVRLFWRGLLLGWLTVTIVALAALILVGVSDGN